MSVKQSKLESSIEVFVNVFSAWLTGLLLQLLLFPIFDWHVSLYTNYVISAMFTSSAVIRGYFFRRLFNNICALQKIHHSALEVILNISTGFIVALLLQIYALPYFGINGTLSENILITLFFTFFAILRGILIRRFFNYRLKMRFENAN